MLYRVVAKPIPVSADLIAFNKAAIGEKTNIANRIRESNPLRYLYNVRQLEMNTGSKSDPKSPRILV